MATASNSNIKALRKAAKKLRDQEKYEWGHMGRCNCGFLAREVTKLTDAEVHQLAMEKSGDWAQQLRDYCPQSGIAMDVIIDIMISEGFTVAELSQLERLESPEVLALLPQNKRSLSHNNAQDAALYLETWAELLQRKFISEMTKTIEQEKIYT